MKPDFTAMTKTELRAYVITHPNDTVAFHAFVDRFTSEASPKTFAVPRTPSEIEEVENLIQEKLKPTNNTNCS